MSQGRMRATRYRQLERDIARAVTRLLIEFADETGRAPHAVDIELEPKHLGERQEYVVSEVRAHFED